MADDHDHKKNAPDETGSPQVYFMPKERITTAKDVNAKYGTKVEILKSAKGPYCDFGEWAVANWKATDAAGNVVEDSSHDGDGRPRNFHIGYREANRCLDILAQQMKKGEKAKVYCPGETGQGGNNDMGSMSGLATEINEYTPLTYELEMIDCDLEPHSFHDVPPAKNWDEGRPIRDNEYFRFVNERTDSKGVPLCLEVEKKDAYAPSVTNLYNVVANQCKHNKHAGAQEWYYHDEDQTIHSVLHPEGVILEGYNKNIVVYKNLLLDSQRFDYKSK
jgi:FKBP-type peptidyl-prolyl cis-trans isomerase